MMGSGLLGLILSAEISRTRVELQKTSDSYAAAILLEQQKAAKPVTRKYTVTYDISYRGEIQADKTEFANLVRETLGSPYGWARAGVIFSEVNSGGRLHIVLASGDQVKAAAPGGCSDTLSCTVKPYVLINDTRWRLATDSYNNAGLSLKKYRQMVINHEVGHFLGHNHLTNCVNGVAPVMLQQSTGLRGCTANEWPLASELWVSGI